MSVGFFRPAYLWALLALLVPLIIHFFNRKRTVRLDISSLRFFAGTAVKANRARTIRRLLQLLARLGIVGAVVLLFAKPHDPTTPFAVLTDPQCAVYVWVDPTVSMGYREGTTVAARAYALVDSLADVLSSLAPPLVYDGQRGGFHADAGPVRVRHGSPGFADAAAALRRQLQESPGPAVLFILSDMQTGSAAEIDSAAHGDSLPCPSVFVSLAPSAPWDMSVEEARVSTANPGIVHAVLAAHGGGTERGELYALVGGLRTGQKEVTLPQDDTQAVAIEIPRDVGGEVGHVVLAGGDPLSVNDTCPFVRRQSQPRGVLIVGDAQRVFPVSAALGAASGGFWGSVVVRTPDAVTVEDIDRAAVVVLDSLSYAPTSLRGLLSGRSLGRKAIVVSPGMGAEAHGFTRSLCEKLSRASRVSLDSSSTPLGAVLSDTLSALWQGFPRVRERDVAVYRWVAGIPGEPLLRLENGRPLVSLYDDTAGHVWLLAASPLGITDANNLCETGFYVPLLDRALRHALSLASPGEDVWVAGRPRRNPYFGRRGGADVHAADNRQVARWDNQPQVVVERPGAYRVVPDGETGYWLIARTDPDELTLAYPGPEAKSERIARVSPGELPDFVREAGQGGLALVLWAVLGGLVLLEMLLWRDTGRARSSS